MFFWEQILKFYNFWLLLNKYYSACIEIYTWYSCFLPVCFWFHGFSGSSWPTEEQELKTSPCLSYISIKSWHFFQVVKKKKNLARLSVNPEESAVIWGPKWSNADSLTFNSFAVCVEEQYLHYSCRIAARRWLMNHVGGASQKSLHFMFSVCDLQDYCCADESSASAFNALTKTFTTSLLNLSSLWPSGLNWG